MTGKERIFAAVQGKPVDSLPLIPISMMVAADEVGEKYGTYIREAAVHARGQVAFAEKYDIDYVSAISCPTTEADSLGASIIHFDDQPPAVDEEHALLADKTTLTTLQIPDPGTAPRMVKRLETIRLMREAVGDDKVVEGWIEGPIAESADLRGINTIMTDLFDDPGFVKDLMDFLFELAMVFAREQVKAGIDMMGIGDAAASLVGPRLYRQYVWEYEKKYIEELHKMGVLVRLHICGNITRILPMLKEVGADILECDSMVSIKTAREDCGAGQLLSGNIDPVRVLKDGTFEEVYSALEQCFQDAGYHKYAVCAGCEVPRGTPTENLEQMRQFARTHVYRAGG